MQDLREALDRMEPPRADTGDWEAVLRDADARRTRRLARPVAAVTAAAAALFALALFQPWEAENPTVLERALAAVGAGPVLHVVLRGEWGGTRVDLETGERQPVHGENEIWYDSERGVVHHTSRLGGIVQYEEVYEPRKPPPELVALGRDYRQALQSGTARVAGEGIVDGIAVFWITIRSSRDLDVADGRLHDWRQQVAVSRETFEPVSLRDTLDGEPGPLGTRQRVLELELLPSGQGDFTASEVETLRGKIFKEGREPVPLEQAEETLGRTPLWLGSEHEGLPLAQAFRRTTATGDRPRIRLTGRIAREAEKCSELSGEEAGRCYRALGHRGSVEVGPDGVFTHGPPVWEEEQIGLQLFYGSVGDDPSTYRTDVVARYDERYVALTQTAHRSPFRRGVGDYVPPEGWVFIAASGRMGALQVKGGLHVTIEASSAELILSAARALEPMPD
jgi:hypothetical protein